MKEGKAQYMVTANAAMESWLIAENSSITVLNSMREATATNPHIPILTPHLGLEKLRDSPAGLFNR